MNSSDKLKAWVGGSQFNSLEWHTPYSHDLGKHPPPSLLLPLSFPTG